MSGTEATDAELVSECLVGDRDAFGRIVARYQALVCSLAYSATGCLGQSEDLAQETFLAAWTHLSQLREPAKLRAWLNRGASKKQFPISFSGCSRFPGGLRAAASVSCPVAQD